jgi:hypothetical protein
LRLAAPAFTARSQRGRGLLRRCCVQRALSVGGTGRIPHAGHPRRTAASCLWPGRRWLFLSQRHAVAAALGSAPARRRGGEGGRGRSGPTLAALSMNSCDPSGRQIWSLDPAGVGDTINHDDQRCGCAPGPSAFRSQRWRGAGLARGQSTPPAVAATHARCFAGARVNGAPCRSTLWSARRPPGGAVPCWMMRGCWILPISLMAVSVAHRSSHAQRTLSAPW